MDLSFKQQWIKNSPSIVACEVAQVRDFACLCVDFDNCDVCSEGKCRTSDANDIRVHESA